MYGAHARQIKNSHGVFIRRLRKADCTVARPLFTASTQLELSRMMLKGQMYLNCLKLFFDPQAFINTAKEIYQKIQDGVFDINNEV